MKKLITLLLALIMLMSLAACASDVASTNAGTANEGSAYSETDRIESDVASTNAGTANEESAYSETDRMESDVASTNAGTDNEEFTIPGTEIKITIDDSFQAIIQTEEEAKQRRISRLTNSYFSQRIMDNEYCNVTSTWILLKSDGTKTLELVLENKTDNSLNVDINLDSYNGLPINKIGSYHLAPLESVVEYLELSNDASEKVYTDIVREIEGDITVCKASDDGTVLAYDRVNIHPYGESFEIKSEDFVLIKNGNLGESVWVGGREAQDSDRVIIDNEDVYAAVTGCEVLEDGQGFVLELYMERRHAHTARCSIARVRVNGTSYEIDMSKFLSYGNADIAAYFALPLTAKGISEIKDIEIDFNITWDLLAIPGPAEETELVTVSVLP